MEGVHTTVEVDGLSRCSISSMKRPVILFLSALPLFAVAPSAGSRTSPPPKTDAPRIIVTAPLGIPPGVPTKISIVGWKLDATAEVRFFEPKVVVKLLKKEKVAVSNQQDPNKIGDSRVEAEVLLPPEMPAADLSFTVVGPAGESPPHKLLIDGDQKPIKEKEPNNGFRQAQAIQVPQIVDGAINPAQDVDVFRFEGNEGQRIVCEVQAARLGSPLDSTLTLYNSARQIIAANDDFNGTPDSRLEVTLPKSGTYYLALTDAHDQGGAQFVYRLVVEAAR